MELPILVLSRKLVDFLERCGVKNLESFPVKFYQNDVVVPRQDHLAVNLLGAVRKEHLSKIKDPASGKKVFTVAFPPKFRETFGGDLFRLDHTNIVSSDKLKMEVEKGGFPNIEFQELGEVFS